MKDKELFSSSPSVRSKRILYTPSSFARTSLLHLQEVGTLQAVRPHTSSRSNLLSYLCFVVLSGAGKLVYEGQQYELTAGDCVFIECQRIYAHSTEENLWELQWCHFNGPSLPAIYEKYRERGGRPVFRPTDAAGRESPEAVTGILSEIFSLAGSSDYIRDMRINEKLGGLLSVLMDNSWHPEEQHLSRKRMELHQVKEYLDSHFLDKILLEDLARMFFVDKFYLSRIFKEAYGVTVIAYVEQKRITKAKSLLRFTDMTMDEIAAQVGMGNGNYFCRRFKKTEGMSPGCYRRLW